MRLRKGRPTDTTRWAELWWMDEGSSDRAVRRQTSDGLWYVTVGYVEAVEITHGPFGSLEAVEMLVNMEMLNDYRTR